MKLHGNINDTQEALAALDTEPIIETVEILRKAKENGNTVYTFGNGGSHSNASHFAQDLLYACKVRSICLSDMIPGILACMNDYGYETTFVHALRALMNEKDVVVAFSCSGHSKNVYYALSYMFKDFRNNPRILFTGDDGGACKELLNLTLIKAPNPNIRIQESCHSVICHAIIEALLDE
jgi:D-sedoheptulose 7-phosphate isomerase